VKLIVGLGNPGAVYADSRHNVGFLVVKALSRIHKTSLKRDKFSSAFIVKINIGDKAVVVAIPVTFMNLSGIAVAALLKKYKIALSNLLVVCDDLDIEFGRIRIKPKGSSAGHRGIKSIIDSVGSDKFCRLRIGVGRPPANVEPSDFVLSPFSRQEKKYIPEVVELSCDCCRAWVSQGIVETMNIFNTKEK